MAVLHNRVSQKELKQKLYSETFPRITLSFYQYADINDPKATRDELYKNLDELNVFGRIYVAHEGINAQVSLPAENFEAFKDYIHSISFLANARLNVAVDSDGKSFWVLKIKVRDKIVADGIYDPAFSMSNKGRYVNALEFNSLANAPDTVIVDMRNHYEYEVGHFENAIEVASDTFREQLPMAVKMLSENKDKNIIMYCTGGIRCEKASAFMMHHGFKNVFHLEGGIINYANTVKDQGLQNKFIGKNFVFDDRLGEKVGEDIISVCHQCGISADTHTNCKNDGCHLLFIQCAACAERFKRCCSQECLEVYNLPLEEQKEIRKGQKNGIMIFNKSRYKRIK